MRNRILIIVLVLFVIMIAAGAGLFFAQRAGVINIVTPTETVIETVPQLLPIQAQTTSQGGGIRDLFGIGSPPPKPNRSILTGIESETKDQKIVAVMIDLAPTARENHTGLESASLLIEAPAEGGVPRIIAFFEEKNWPAKIGPVRSARDYFVEWAEPIADIYVHAGGSPEAMQMLISSRLFDINEQLNDERWERDDSIRRPHNLFLIPENIAFDKTETLSNPIFRYAQDAVAGENAALKIDIDTPSRTHAVQWQWSENRQCYRRIQSLESTDICVTNVVIMATDMFAIAGDEKNRIDIRTIGDGDALVFGSGRATPAIWSRAADQSWDLKGTLGNDILLTPGKTFVHVVPQITDARYSE